MRRTFAVTAIALFMFSLDRTVVLTALPDIGADLERRGDLPFAAPAGGKQSAPGPRTAKSPPAAA